MDRDDWDLHERPLASSSTTNSDDSVSNDFLENESASSSSSGTFDVTSVLVDDFPVPFCIIHWDGKESGDIFDWTITAANKILDEVNYKKPQTVPTVGRKYCDQVPGVREYPHLFHNYIKVATEGIQLEEMVKMGNENFDEDTFRVRYFPMPNDSCMIVFESITSLRKTEERIKNQREQIDDILDRAVDVIITDQEEEKNDWKNQALKNLFSYDDISKSDLLVEEFEKKQKVISVADVETLIRKSVTADKNDQDYIKQFLISFRYFITPVLLMKKLLVRFVSRMEAGDESSTKKVYDLMRNWIREHYYDFEGEPELMDILNSFITKTLFTSRSELYTKMGESLKKLLASMDEQSEVSTTPTIALKSEKNTNARRSIRKVNILDISPTDLAHQLTLIAFERFKSIKPVELYSSSWAKENAVTMAPNVVAMIKNFNKISNWVASEILVHTNLRKRALLLKHFISIAWITSGYRDFETTFAIVLGLQRTPVSRLSETWKSLDNTTKTQWEKLTDLTNLQGNYKSYRSFMKKLSGKNVIPYFGLYLKDLTSLEENNNFTEMGAVNFYKMRMIASIISEITRLQSSIFNFAKDVKLISFLSYELPSYDEDTIWELSMLCETSSAEDAAKLKSSHSNEQKQEVLTVTSNPIFGMKKPIQKSTSSESQKVLKTSSDEFKKLVNKFEGTNLDNKNK